MGKEINVDHIVNVSLSGKVLPESYCWKFVDENNKYNVWLIVTLQKIGEIMLVNEVVPLDDGGFVHIIKYTEYKTVMQNTYIKVMKSKHKNFGIVSISRMKIQEFYEGTTTTIFKTNFKVFREDANGNRIEITGTTSFKFPPLPQGEAKDRQSEAASAGGRIYFPLVEKISPGEKPIDYYTGEGIHADAEAPPADAAMTGTQPPGIYVEFAEQGGNPLLMITLFWMVTPEGSAKYLFGNYCTGYSYHYFRQTVIVKKKGSWFRKKKKITIRREELKIDGVSYHDI